jgi:hypothetical protein
LKTTPVHTPQLSGNVWVDRLNNEKYHLPDTIGGKPVSFYLNNAKVASIAKSFYIGRFRLKTMIQGHNCYRLSQQMTALSDPFIVGALILQFR